MGRDAHDCACEHASAVRRHAARGDIGGDGDVGARPLVFDRLTHTDAGGEAAPSLAVRWAQENQAQRWQFWLRPGVRFHDGTEMTAEDVVRSLTEDCAADAGGSCGWKTLRAVGDSVVMTTDSPAPTMPAELARAEYIITHKDAAGETDGTGAFKITSQSRDTAMLVAVNDAWAGRPFVDAVEIDGRRDLRTQLLDLSVGRADRVDCLMPEAEEMQPRRRRRTWRWRLLRRWA